MKFCPICRYYLYLETDEQTCNRLCRNCGYKEKEENGSLISETLVKERTSEGYKILLNEFTRQDSTLPHLKTMKCHREDCKSNGGGAEKDVIYIKYDSENLKYLYICNVCGEYWRTRG
jgi:DNA-directed RNA polymerase subunit M/transcription elongation factor TFIIS